MLTPREILEAWKGLAGTCPPRPAGWPSEHPEEGIAQPSPAQALCSYLLMRRNSLLPSCCLMELCRRKALLLRVASP